MKNIHVIPTEQPSRLWVNTITGKLVLDKEPNTLHNQNIYITSDDEFKEGDYFITKTNDVLKVQKPEKSYDPIGEKIILTTDTNLIADGVQTIDDKFLQWFVKNPSCVFVKVDKQYITPLGDVVNTCYDNERLNYKIIIPKDEPKQDHFQEMNDFMIKGTLEEAAERLIPDNYIKVAPKKKVNAADISRHYFIEGAKWQAERMYSDLSELRNDLYDKLPIGDVFEILKVIKNHLQKLDALCGNK